MRPGDDVLKMLATVAAGGTWDGIDNVDELTHVAQKEQAAGDDLRRREEAMIVAAALDNPAGRRFIEWLMHNTVLYRGPDKSAAATTAEMYAIAKGERQGEINVFYMIVDALDAARNTKPTEG